MGFHGLFIQIWEPSSLRKAGKNCGELLGLDWVFLLRTTLKPKGWSKRMNAMVSQKLRCLIHDTKKVKSWEIVLPTVEMAINSVPNQSTGFSPFFLNYGYEPVMPIQLLRGDESTKMESVASFIKRVTSDWNLARKNLQWSVGLQQKYYDQKYRDIHYNVGDLVLLSTRNLR